MYGKFYIFQGHNKKVEFKLSSGQKLLVITNPTLKCIFKTIVLHTLN